MYKTRQQLIDQEYFILSGENLASTSVHNRVHIQIAENCEIMYNGAFNIANQVGIDLDDDESPKYTSHNYLSDGTDIKTAIEILDSALYEIYTMVVTGTKPTSGVVDEEGDEDEPPPPPPPPPPNIIEYTIMRLATPTYHASISSNYSSPKRLDPFAISACVYKGEPRVTVGFGYRADLLKSTAGSQKDFVSSNRGFTWKEYWNTIQKDYRLFPVPAEGRYVGLLNSYIYNDKCFDGLITHGYKDRFSQDRMIGIFTARAVGSTNNMSMFGRWKFKNNMNDVPFKENNAYGAMGGNGKLVVTSFMNSSRNIFTTYIDYTTTPPTSTVFVSLYANDLSGGSFHAIKPFHAMASEDILLSGVNGRNVTSFVFENLNSAASTSEKMIWAYKDISGAYKYRPGPADGSTWGAEGDLSEFITLPANLVGTPTAITLADSSRTLIACLSYSLVGSSYVPKINTYLSSGTENTSWKAYSEYLIADVLPSVTAIPDRRRKIVLMQLGPDAPVLGYLIKEAMTDADTSKVVQITFMQQIERILLT